jgi:hypothetical protein
MPTQEEIIVTVFALIMIIISAFLFQSTIERSDRIEWRRHNAICRDNILCDVMTFDEYMSGGRK